MSIGLGIWTFCSKAVKLQAFQACKQMGANYGEAIEILQSRFAQKQVTVLAHMDALLSLKHHNLEKDVRGLRMLFDKLETNILKSLG